ncbi:hypothetical protein RIF23_01315 [Lipingzhangella sp. LS1_29]|uniref:Uncharacterized protein n=1 Tax=Lipingzhangella rawalii TaxID=2055835 RepID=A0ABU2H0U6_9ACTN|nr:hypothetical protein [Lipingzhangella rawalii]MDS1268926.1 hypothetical protein [Lipingzhangella rawalii]
MRQHRSDVSGTDPPVGPGRDISRCWTRATYWLMYAVAVAAAWVHWQSGSHALAFGCAVVAALGAWFIARERGR